MKLSYRKLMVSIFSGFVALAATQSSFAMFGLDGGNGYREMSNEDIRRAFSERKMEDSEKDSEDEEQLYGSVITNKNLEKIENKDLTNFINLYKNKLFHRTDRLFHRTDRLLDDEVSVNYVIIMPCGNGCSKIKFKTLYPTWRRVDLDDDFKDKYSNYVNYVNKMKYYASRGYDEHIKYLSEKLEKRFRTNCGKARDCFYLTKELIITVSGVDDSGNKKDIIHTEKFQNINSANNTRDKVEFKVDLSPEKINTIKVVAKKLKNNDETYDGTYNVSFAHKVQEFDILRYEGDRPKTNNKLFNYVFSI